MEITLQCQLFFKPELLSFVVSSSIEVLTKQQEPQSLIGGRCRASRVVRTGILSNGWRWVLQRGWIAVVITDYIICPLHNETTYTATTNSGRTLVER